MNRPWRLSNWKSSQKFQLARATANFASIRRGILCAAIRASKKSSPRSRPKGRTNKATRSRQQSRRRANWKPCCTGSWNSVAGIPAANFRGGRRALNHGIREKRCERLAALTNHSLATSRGLVDAATRMPCVNAALLRVVRLQTCKRLPVPGWPGPHRRGLYLYREAWNCLKAFQPRGRANRALFRRKKMLFILPMPLDSISKWRSTGRWQMSPMPDKAAAEHQPSCARARTRQRCIVVKPRA